MRVARRCHAATATALRQQEWPDRGLRPEEWQPQGREAREALGRVVEDAIGDRGQGHLTERRLGAAQEPAQGRVEELHELLRGHVLRGPIQPGVHEGDVIDLVRHGAFADDGTWRPRATSAEYLTPEPESGVLVHWCKTRQWGFRVTRWHMAMLTAARSRECEQGRTRPTTGRS